MLEDFDRRISLTSEAIARKLSRRRVLVNSVKGLVAVVAGVTMAHLVNLKQAFADSCCDGIRCDQYFGKPCPVGTGTPGCPTGCSLCTCGGTACPYSNGYWMCPCGTYGNGHYFCSDCKCPDCDHVGCVCQSDICICAGCQTPQDVEDEMRRLSEAGIP